MIKKDLIMGIDPGLKNTGWCLIENQTHREIYIAHGVINTKTHNILGERLSFIYDRLDNLMKQFNPNFVAVEKIFSNVNTKSSLNLGKARGIAFLVAAKNNVPLSEYSPNTVKKNLVGYGHANKFQIIQMINRLFPKAQVIEEDAADALAVAICHSMQAKSKIKDVMEKYDS